MALILLSAFLTPVHATTQSPDPNSAMIPIKTVCSGDHFETCVRFVKRITILVLRLPEKWRLPVFAFFRRGFELMGKLDVFQFRNKLGWLLQTVQKQLFRLIHSTEIGQKAIKFLAPYMTKRALKSFASAATSLSLGYSHMSTSVAVWSDPESTTRQRIFSSIHTTCSVSNVALLLSLSEASPWTIFWTPISAYACGASWGIQGYEIGEMAYDLWIEWISLKEFVEEELPKLESEYANETKVSVWAPSLDTRNVPYFPSTIQKENKNDEQFNVETICNPECQLYMVNDKGEITGLLFE